MSNSELGDRFGVRATFDTGNGPASYYRLARLEELGIAAVSRLPFSIRVLLEAMLREADGMTITDNDVLRLATWNAKTPAQGEVPFKPARVIMHDLSGIPCLVVAGVVNAALAPVESQALTLRSTAPTRQDRDAKLVQPLGKAGRIQFWDWRKGEALFEPLPMPSEPRGVN